MSGARGLFRLIPIAVVVAAALAGIVTWLQGAGIEQDLASRSETALASAGLPAGHVDFDGRDATLSGFPPDVALKALDVVQKVDGVRNAQIQGDVNPVGPGPAPQPGTTTKPSPSPSSTSPPPSTPPPTDQAGIQAELDRMLAASPISFEPDSAKLTPEGEQAVKAIAPVLTAAPSTLRFQVNGHVAKGPGGERAALRLSLQRASSVTKLLRASGVPSKRVVAKGLGDAHPAPGGDDRRAEIIVEQG